MLTKRGRYWYGDKQSDVHTEIQRYSKRNGYPATHVADASCSCGSRAFRLFLDEDAGAAVRVCPACEAQHPIGDSADYLDDAELEEYGCPCGKEGLEISVGISLYTDSEDVRWLYLACRCTACGLTAVYGDWKNEFPAYTVLLQNV